MSVRVCNEGLADAEPAVPRIVAVGDVHGDLTALLCCLMISECVSADEMKWIAPPGTVMVILGDVVDRYRRSSAEAGILLSGAPVPPRSLARSLGEFEGEELKALDVLNKLARQAHAAGSGIVRLVGNHELMQMTYTPNFFYQREYASPLALGGTTDDDMLRRYASFAEQDGKFHARIADCKPKAIIQIGSHVFVHGGINEAVIEHANGMQMPLIELANDMLEDVLSSSPDQPTRYAADDIAAILTGVGPRRRGRNRHSGVLWDDDLSASLADVADNDACSAAASRILKKLNENMRAYSRREHQDAKHLVVSHCYQFNRQGARATGGATTASSAGEVPGRVVTRNEVVAEFTTRDASPRWRPTPADNQTMNAVCDGLVWRVDVGMSRAFAFDSVKAGLTDEQARVLRNSQRPSVLIIDDDGRDYAVRQYVPTLPGIYPPRISL